MQEIPLKKRTAEYLGPVKINHGQHEAELRRERDPTGATVVHTVRKSQYVHERLRSQNKLNQSFAMLPSDFAKISSAPS